MLIWLIVIPLILIVGLNLPFRKSLADSLVFWLALAFCIGQSILALSSGYLHLATAPSALAAFLRFTPITDNLSRVMFLAIGIVSTSVILAIRYWIAERSRRFLCVSLVLLADAGMNGIVLSNDLFSLYVFLELTSVASFVLIAFDRDRSGLEGAFKYLIQSAVASVMLLSGIGLILLLTGNTSFSFVKLALLNMDTNLTLVHLAVGLLVTGLLIKAGLVPFHGWVPDAYSSAPAPASAFLAGIVSKTGGIYTLVRLFESVYSPGRSVETVLLIVGCVSLLAGAFLALVQTDFKRMLAYSSISQMGYIVLGIASFNPLGIAGAVFHLFNHAIFKSLLFINAAAVEKETGTRNMSEMGGLSNRMPLTGTTSVVGFLSTAGIPPLSGFWSKLMIILGVWKAGHPAYAVIAVGGSLLTLAYFLVMQRRIFFGKTSPEYSDLREASAWATTPAVILAVITILLGLAFPWLFRSFLVSSGSFL